MTSLGDSDLVSILQLSGLKELSGLNNSGQMVSLLCSEQESGVNSTSLQRHDGPSSGSAAGSGVQMFRVVFDLYVVGLICLVGFVGESPYKCVEHQK